MWGSGAQEALADILGIFDYLKNSGDVGAPVSLLHCLSLPAFQCLSLPFTAFQYLKNSGDVGASVALPFHCLSVHTLVCLPDAQQSLAHSRGCSEIQAAKLDSARWHFLHLSPPDRLAVRCLCSTRSRPRWG